MVKRSDCTTIKDIQSKQKRGIRHFYRQIREHRKLIHWQTNNELMLGNP